jgi:phosphatidylethanolamine/phosphatidyl-N-methylethanolamine N-methyltransferase
MTWRNSRVIEPEIYSALVGSSLRGRYHGYSHKKLEKNLQEKTFDSVLEVGSGEGEHVKFVRHVYRNYTLTDIVVPKGERLPSFPNVRFEQADVEKLSYQNQTFDRVVVTCLLHHLPSPENALNEIRRVTKIGGVVSILLPCDPGLVFRFIRGITADRFLKKQGIQNVGYLRAIEHKNHYLSLREIAKEVFKEDELRMQMYPVSKLPWHFSLFSVIQIRIIK